MQPSRTILACLVEGHPRNISVKLFEQPSCLLEKNNFMFLVGSQLGIIPVKYESK